MPAQALCDSTAVWVVKIAVAIADLPAKKVNELIDEYPELQLRIKRAGRFGAPRVNKKGDRFKEQVRTKGSSLPPCLWCQCRSQALQTGSLLYAIGAWCQCWCRAPDRE